LAHPRHLQYLYQYAGVASSAATGDRSRFGLGVAAQFERRLTER
jgi:hypothetical protein